MRRIKLPTSFDVKFSDQGDLLASAGRNIVVADVAKGERRFSKHPISNPSRLTFSPDGSQLAVKSTSGQIVVLDSMTGELISDFENVADGEGAEAHFSPDGRHLVDGSWDGVVRVREIVTGNVIFQRLFPGQMVHAVSADTRRRQLLFLTATKWSAGLATSPPDEVHIGEWGDFNAARTIRLAFFCKHAALSPDGGTFVCCARQPLGLVIASTRDGDVLAFTETGYCSHVAWSPDGTLVSAVQEDGVRVYRATDLRIVQEFPLKYPACATFHPDGKRIALGTWERGEIVTLSAA